MRMNRRLAFTALAAILAGLSALATGGAAQASGVALHTGASKMRIQAAPDVTYSCSGTPNQPSRRCYFQTKAPAGYSGHAPLFSPDGSLHLTLPLNDKVLVTCYYFGNPPSSYAGDGIEDHVTWENGVGSYTGHIPDPYINEGNATPPDYPYELAEC